jgi:formamidopyrimidine-DNA glycosylase
MPELPEVETYRRDLEGSLVGRTFDGARCDWPRQLPVNSPEDLAVGVLGYRVVAVGRHGKFLRIELEGGNPAAVRGVRGRGRGGPVQARSWLLVHLGMSGSLRCVPAGTPADAHAHVVFTLDGGDELRFRDPRKFGRVRLVADADAALSALGPDALDANWTPAAFKAQLAGRRRQLKPLLLDQSFVAGIGNIYADESLWAARLHPLGLADRVRPREAAALHGAIRGVLTRSVEARGTTFTPGGYRDFWGEPGAMVSELQVFRRTGEPCVRCGTAIQRLIVGGRSTHICPRCQRLRQ